MIENFTAQPYPLWVTELDTDTPLLVIGWTGSLAEGEWLWPVVVPADAPAAPPRTLNRVARFSLERPSVRAAYLTGSPRATAADEVRTQMPGRAGVNDPLTQTRRR